MTDKDTVETGTAEDAEEEINESQRTGIADIADDGLCAETC